MEDSRGIPKRLGGTEAELLAAEAAAEAGWQWPRVRMMAQSPDLQSSTPETQREQPPRQRGAWSQIWRFVNEVTEVFDDSDSLKPPVGSQAAQRSGLRHPAAWIVAGWAVLVAVDWVLTSTAMPRVVAWLSAQPWGFTLDDSGTSWKYKKDELELDLLQP
ncbi:hypothetical protein GGI21_004298, partial [Coemansia aciculifera]